jgi:hypothetical protein
VKLIVTVCRRACVTANIVTVSAIIGITGIIVINAVIVTTMTIADIKMIRNAPNIMMSMMMNAAKVVVVAMAAMTGTIDWARTGLSSVL